MAKELIATLITNGNGEAFYTYTGTGAGETTFIAESGDLESEPLIINDVLESITLTADKNILSYADNDTVTLTATYEGTNVSGKSVVFKIGDTVLDTVNTDSNGIATYEYESQGVGDVTITVECMNLQETYAIEDCLYYDSQTVDKQRYSTTTGTASVTYSSDGLTVKGTGNSETRVENTALTLPSNYVATLKVTGKQGGGGSGTQYYGGFAFDDLLLDFKSTTHGITRYTLSTLSSLGEMQYSIQLNDVIKIERENGTMKIYVNDDLKATHTISSTGKFLYRTYNNRSLTIKDLKVKSL